MKVITGLEVIKQQITDSNFNQREIDWVQDGVDYIKHLEEQIKRFKEQLKWSLETCIHLNDTLPHPSASDDFVFQRELKVLKEETQ
jgi:hypothetical protein